MKRIPATMERTKEAWKYIPLVKLGEMLKQMIWFSGSYILNISKDAYESANHSWIPRRAALDIEYRKRQITIDCIWEERDSTYSVERRPDRFAIGTRKPYHLNFRIQRWRVENAIIYKHTRYYSTAIDRIEDAIHDAQEVIDNEIAEKEKQKKQEQQTRETKKELCKKLDVKITSDETELSYRKDSEYHLNFESSENGLYEISGIGGEYTETEIKKIIEIVGGNPRAIAERLSR